MRTPKKSLPLQILAFALYATAPLIEWNYLFNALSNGEFPVNADSIGLPYLSFLAIWLLFAPFILAFLVWAIWKYPANVSLFGFNHERPIWTLVWSFLFALLFFDELKPIWQNLLAQNFVDLIQGLAMLYFILLLRAVIVFRKLR